MLSPLSANVESGPATSDSSCADSSSDSSERFLVRFRNGVMENVRFLADSCLLGAALLSERPLAGHVVVARCLNGNVLEAHLLCAALAAEARTLL